MVQIKITRFHRRSVIFAKFVTGRRNLYGKSTLNANNFPDNGSLRLRLKTKVLPIRSIEISLPHNCRIRSERNSGFQSSIPRVHPISDWSKLKSTFRPSRHNLYAKSTLNANNFPDNGPFGSRTETKHPLTWGIEIRRHQNFPIIIEMEFKPSTA
jgi:hypothetical protein